MVLFPSEDEQEIKENILFWVCLWSYSCTITPLRGPTGSFSYIQFSQRWKYNQFQNNSSLNGQSLKLIILSCQFVSVFYMLVVKAVGSCKKYASY
jgi:hypothetical protein